MGFLKPKPITAFLVGDYNLSLLRVKGAQSILYWNNRCELAVCRGTPCLLESLVCRKQSAGHARKAMLVSLHEGDGGDGPLHVVAF